MLHYGIIGGGNVAAIHRFAAALDGKAVLTAGCLSRDPEKNRTLGEAWSIPSDRLYGSWQEMAEREAQRPDPLDYVVVSTPNSSHFEIASAFLQRGFHVMCEKPMTNTVEEADRLKAIAEESGRLLCVNYAYSGYPMLHQARQMIRNGELGTIVKVVSEYKQDNQILPGSTTKPWHFDPAITGPTGCVADIGTHIAYLTSFVTGLEIQELSALLSSTLPQTELDSDFSAMVKYTSGATGTMWGSKVAIGDDCNILLHVIGTKGSLRWSHLTPNQLTFAPINEPVRTLVAGRSYLDPEAKALCRLSSGHMEGHFEAIGNLYRRFFAAIEARRAGETVPEGSFPDASAGREGVAFIHACCDSHSAGGEWVRL